MTLASFGKLPDGRQAQLFTITGVENRRVSITNYGGIITSVIVPDIKRDVPGTSYWGYDTLDEYLRDNAYFGATVDVSPTVLRERLLRLTAGIPAYANEGPNILHGGRGFNTKLWDAEIIDNGVRLRYVSPDGEDGFPGTLEVTADVTFKDELKCEFTAVSDKDTVVSLTNHTFFNLNCRGDVLSHVLSINAANYLTVG